MKMIRLFPYIIDRTAVMKNSFPGIYMKQPTKYECATIWDTQPWKIWQRFDDDNTMFYKYIL